VFTWEEAGLLRLMILVVTWTVVAIIIGIVVWVVVGLL